MLFLRLAVGLNKRERYSMIWLWGGSMSSKSRISVQFEQIYNNLILGRAYIIYAFLPAEMRRAACWLNYFSRLLAK